MGIPTNCPKTIAEIHDALLELNKQSYKDKVCMTVQTLPMEDYTVINAYVNTENKRAKRQCLTVTFWPEEVSNSDGNAKEWKAMLAYYERQRKYIEAHPIKR